jgi:putative membrane protein insertion efficiency factor
VFVVSILFGNAYIMKKILIAGIRIYQRLISPYKGFKCPYIPSCSCYAVEAIETHGSFKGFGLAVWRILRCNPFSRGGYDPVPEKKMMGHGRFLQMEAK